MKKDFDGLFGLCGAQPRLMDAIKSGDAAKVENVCADIRAARLLEELRRQAEEEAQNYDWGS